jgi:hypothetical protein
MALVIGDVTAAAGMTKAVYDQVDALLSPPLQKAVDEATDAKVKDSAQKALDAARDGWKKLAFAIATGVVQHLLANLEVAGVQTSGTVTATVQGQVATAVGVTFTQSNDGTGRLR